MPTNFSFCFPRLRKLGYNTEGGNVKLPLLPCLCIHRTIVYIISSLYACTAVLLISKCDSIYKHGHVYEFIDLNSVTSRR